MRGIPKIVSARPPDSQRRLFAHCALNRLVPATAPIVACLAVFAPCTVLAGEVVPGLVSITSAGKAHFHFVDPLPPGQSVFIQTPTKDGKVRCCQRLNRADLQDDLAPSEDVTNIVGNAVSSYVLPWLLAGPFGDDGFIGIAMSAPSVSYAGPYAVRGKFKGKVTHARLCFGTEGINLIAKTRHEYRALYMSTGYGIDEQPKCTKADERDIGKVSR